MQPVAAAAVWSQKLRIAERVAVDRENRVCIRDMSAGTVYRVSCYASAPVD